MSRKKILVVEDDRDLRLGLAVRLRDNGYEVVFASDGVTATSVARKEQPDLIILDLGLPGGDGFVVMERLKMLLPTAHTPVIVLTARNPAFEERALKAGAVAFFQKPVESEALLAAIGSALGEPRG